MVEGDLDAIVAIDAKLTGRDRRLYYQAKLKEVIGDTSWRGSTMASSAAPSRRR
jgi:hypothetical protein